MIYSSASVRLSYSFLFVSKSLCLQGWKAATISPRPDSGRQGLLLPVEDDRWQLIMTGMAGAHALLTNKVFDTFLALSFCGTRKERDEEMCQVGMRNLERISFQRELDRCAGDHPPTDEEGYLEFARSLPQLDIYDAIRQAEPIGPVYTYSRTENIRRRYEKVSTWLRLMVKPLMCFASRVLYTEMANVVKSAILIEVCQLTRIRTNSFICSCDSHG